LTGGIYDHLLAVVLVGAIFVAAVAALPNVGYVSLLSVDQQQMRNLALDVLKTMLLDAGYPTDWGSYQVFTNSTVQRFGLALDDSSSFYVLDPDKVSRLNLDNPAGFVGYETIRDRLRLQGYGFDLRITPPFNVTINDGNPVDLATMRNGVKVLVTHSDDKRPIPNAAVKAKIIYSKTNDNNQFYWATPLSNSTDVLGKCTIKNTDPDFQSANVQDFVLVLTVTVADLTTITATYMSGFHQQIASASMIGDTVTLHIPENVIPSEQPRGERRIMSVASVSESGVSTVYNGGDPNNDKMTWGEKYSYKNYTFPGIRYEDSLFLIFTIRVSLGKGGGLSLVLFLGPRPNWMGARIQDYGDPRGAASGSAVKVQRNVLIAGMTYRVEFTLWKQQ